MGAQVYRKPDQRRHGEGSLSEEEVGKDWEIELRQIFPRGDKWKEALKVMNIISAVEGPFPHAIAHTQLLGGFIVSACVSVFIHKLCWLEDDQRAGELRDSEIACYESDYFPLRSLRCFSVCLEDGVSEVLASSVSDRSLTPRILTILLRLSLETFSAKRDFTSPFLNAVYDSLIMPLSVCCKRISPWFSRLLDPHQICPSSRSSRLRASVLFRHFDLRAHLCKALQFYRLSWCEP